MPAESHPYLVAKMAPITWIDIGCALIAATAYAAAVILLTLCLTANSNWEVAEPPWATTPQKHPTCCDDDPGLPMLQERSVVPVDCEDPPS